MTVTMGLSLRWRVAILLGLGLLLVTSALAATTWNLATDYMLRQREQNATLQAEVNVRLTAEAVRSDPGELEDLLAGLTTDPDSTILLLRADQVITSGRQVHPEQLPNELLGLAREGLPARQRLSVGGIPVLAVTVPTTVPDTVFVELFPLTQLDRVFRFLSTVLIAGTLASAAIGVAIGVWAARRALHPLTVLTAAASRIAAGDLGARLPAQTDRDLAPLAATFNTTAETLERRVRRDARFAGDVSHELRSPLTTMVNAAEILNRRRADLPATAATALDLLTSEVDRFARMVVDLTEISRADQAVDETALEPVDVAELLTDLPADRLSPGTRLDIESPPPLVTADRVRLDRVLVNLLENAERHAGGATRLAVRREAGRVRIEVDDEGPGVPPDLRTRVFERFARGARSGSRGDDVGSGLGLALVAEHVRKQAGRVWVEDRPGGGARFVVELREARP